MKNQTCKKLSLSCNGLFAAAVTFMWGVVLPANAQTTWDGGGNGVNWLDAANWVGDDAPDTAAEDVLIDGGVTVLLDPPDGTILDIGSLTVDAGNTLNLRYDSGTLNATGGLSNSGTLSYLASPSNNARTEHFNVSGTNQTFNTATGDITLNTNSGRNRINVIMTLDAQNQNDGAITANITGSADRDTVRFRLENSGTFTNNGSILIQNTEPSTSSYVQMQLLTASSAVTLGGTGSLTLDVGTLTDANRARISGISSATPSTLTNGSSHTIEGAGAVLNSIILLNDGLIHATGDTAEINMNVDTVNNAGGRMVASGLAGMVIGNSFTNNGLLEARNGSSISLGTSTVNGTVAGDGNYTATTFSLTGSATLNPGDLSNSDGTGTSTVGGMDITGDLALADTTILNFQLGDNSAAGLTFDTVAVSGALTLDGILNVSDLAGFGTGSYRLFTFSSGNLTDNGVTLGSTPGAYTYSLDADNAGGFVDLTVIPEPSTWALVTGAFGILYLFRRRRG